ncbi:hypothetical protein [Kitasatospora sp. NPDC088346]|uniref:hypothetical protein n=1 Tax=Kitasatospora sp. NPDC088346 TaxID=3364073 RepID=UPI003824965B
MALTTIKVKAEVRDELARLAADDLGGVTLGTALEHLLTEHRKAQILAAYARLEAVQTAWTDCQNELDEWDAVAGDGLGGEA